MIDFLHNFEPSSVLLSFGKVTLYWYGLFVVIGIISAIFVSTKLAKRRGIQSDTIIDLSLWLIIAGLLGARIYDVLLELPYYLEHPANVFKIWQGGLAIHGGIIGGLLAIWLFTKKEKLELWLMTDLIVPGLALGQAIGRWGNYFNQELFGRPTNLPWGIPISMINRPSGYAESEYYHPTFLYESIGDLLIFGLLITLFYRQNKTGAPKNGRLTLIYLLAYSILRFSLEFIRIDYAPGFGGLRWPQWTSLIIIAVSAIFLVRGLKKSKQDDTVQNSSQF